SWTLNDSGRATAVHIDNSERRYTQLGPHRLVDDLNTSANRRRIKPSIRSIGSQIRELNEVRVPRIPRDRVLNKERCRQADPPSTQPTAGTTDPSRFPVQLANQAVVAFVMHEHQGR